MLDKQLVHAAAEQLYETWDVASGPGGLFDPRNLAAALPSVLASFDDPENTTPADVLLEIGDGDFDEVLCAALVLQKLLGPHHPPREQGSTKVEAGELLFVHGDLHVMGELANGGMIVVTGDLTVDGCFWDADVGNQLVVLGNTRLGWLNLYGGARLAGDLAVREMLYGIDHSDILQVQGDVTATLVILDDTHLVARNLRARLVMDPDHVKAPLEEELDASIEWLVPDVLREGEIDVDEVLRFLADGVSIWRLSPC